MKLKLTGAVPEHISIKSYPKERKITESEFDLPGMSLYFLDISPLRVGFRSSGPPLCQLNLDNNKRAA